MYTIPTVLEQSANGERAFDLFSRLLRDRIIILGTAIDDAVANIAVAQLLYLENEAPDKDICMYINSPGGSVTAGLAIYDTMKYIRPDVSTVCVGMAASMGALLLAAGAKGKRFALPNANIMIHQPMGGVQGQATDVDIHVRMLMRMKRKLNAIMAECTGKTEKRIALDTDRDNFMTPEEAQKYGLIDQIISRRV